MLPGSGSGSQPCLFPGFQDLATYQNQAVKLEEQALLLSKPLPQPGFLFFVFFDFFAVAIVVVVLDRLS